MKLGKGRTEGNTLPLLQSVTVRNPGGSAVENALFARQVASGERLGPEMVWAAEVIDRSPIAFEGLASLVTPERGVADIVAHQAAAGAHYVKLYTGLDESDLREGIVAAAENDVQTIGHLADVSWTTAAELGIDSLVHAIPTSPELLPQDRREPYLDSRRPGTFQFFEWYEMADLDAPEIAEMIAALARHDVSLDATLVAFEPAFHGDDEALLSSRAEHAHPQKHPEIFYGVGPVFSQTIFQSAARTVPEFAAGFGSP